MLSAPNVKYRDFRYIVPFIVQFGLYISPGGIVPERWRLVYSLNPMVGVIDGFRWAILGREAKLTARIHAVCGISDALLASGIWYFRKMERSFADVI